MDDPTVSAEEHGIGAPDGRVMAAKRRKTGARHRRWAARARTTSAKREPMERCRYEQWLIRPSLETAIYDHCKYAACADPTDNPEPISDWFVVSRRHLPIDEYISATKRSIYIPEKVDHRDGTARTYQDVEHQKNCWFIEQIHEVALLALTLILLFPLVFQ